MDERIVFRNEDCLVGMDRIPDKSVDMILSDLPYGVTKNSWDVPIPFDKLWAQYERVIKDDGAIALFSSQPFTTDLINSNRKLFRYDLVWDKVLAGNFLNSHKMPLRTHETICIFYKRLPKYNPIMEVRGKPKVKGRKDSGKSDGNSCYGDYGPVQAKNNEYYPKSILTFSNGNRNDGRIHSTQKPVDLMSYLIRTYTDPGDLVLDSCAGSCSTGKACYRTGRRFIGFENNKRIYDLAKKGLDEEMSQMNLWEYMDDSASSDMEKDQMDLWGYMDAASIL